MNMTESQHELTVEADFYPGSYLASVRKTEGLSQEYIAEKLYLRTQVVQLLEADAYDKLPQPVFVQGYLRAYAKLMGLDPEPLIERYVFLNVPAKKADKVLLQRNKSTGFNFPKITKLVFGFTLFVSMSVYLWWSHSSSVSRSNHAQLSQENKLSKQGDNVLTDLTQMDVGMNSPTKLNVVVDQNSV